MVRLASETQQHSATEAWRLSKRIASMKHTATTLPTCFFYAGDHSLLGEISETDSAYPELSIDGSRTTAELASVLNSSRKLRFSLRFQYLCFACHCFYTKLSAHYNAVFRHVNPLLQSVCKFGCVKLFRESV